MADFSYLKTLLSGTLILKSEKDKAYRQEIDNAWNGVARACRPEAFIVAATVEDVVNTVKFCVKNELDFCVSGANNSEFSMVDGAVVVDLSAMNSVTVDVKRKLAVVGGGAQLKDVDKETSCHCLVTPLASYSELGVAGVAVLGGTGFLSRSYGCTADNVLEFELVTASGDIVKASSEENPELFWGMKGYGANFGVVTSLKFQLFDLPNDAYVTGGELFYPMNRAKEVFKTIRNFIRDEADNRLSVYMMVHFRRIGPQALCRFLFNGPPKDGGKLLMELCDKTHPSVNKVKTVLFDEFQKSGDWMVPRGRLYYMPMGSFVGELTDEGIDIIIDSSNQAPDPRAMVDSNIYITSLGGRIEEIPQDSSPYPFRPAEYWVGVVAAAKDANFYDAIKTWADDIDQKIAKYGIFPQGAAAAEVQNRLKELKLQYDPKNVFHHNFNIDPNS